MNDNVRYWIATAPVGAASVLAEELEALAAKRASAAFDVDVYRILVRYFANNRAPDWIDLRGSTICT